jgi:hypothetical protein
MLSNDASEQCRACLASSGDLDELHKVLVLAAQGHDLATVLGILEQAAKTRAGTSGRPYAELYEAYRGLIAKYAYVERYADRQHQHAKVASEMRSALRKMLDLL